jgi:hypothetical protein
MTKITQEELDTIQASIQLPYVLVGHMALGGTESVIVNVALDKKEDWPYGIFHNARGATFTWSRTTTKMEQLTRWKVAYFRTRKVKDLGTFVAKINDCMAKPA